MKRKNIIITIVVVLALAFIIRALTPKSYSGVDEMKAAISKELNKDIEVFDTITKNDKVFVGYSDGKYGYALFNKNKDGEFDLFEVKRTDKLLKRADGISVDNRANYFVVISGNKNLAKIEYVTDTGYEKKISVSGTPSLTVIEQPEGNFNGEYNFYDSHGILIR